MWILYLRWFGFGSLFCRVVSWVGCLFYLCLYFDLFVDFSLFCIVFCFCLIGLCGIDLKLGL